MGVRRYSAREVAKALGLHIRTVERACNRGDLESYRTPSGRYHLIDEPALADWMAREVFARTLSRSRQSHYRRTPPMPDNPATEPRDKAKPKG